MNANLINANLCTIDTDNAAATTQRTLPMLKNVMRFLMALTLLVGMMAARPAKAQGLYLPKFTNILTLTDGSTKKSVTAYLDVTQDKLGNLGGNLVINNTDYKITGTLSWEGTSWPNYYWLNISATYNSSGLLFFTETYHLSGLVYVENADTIEYFTNNYTWSSDFDLHFSSGGGTYSGIGFYIQ